MNTPVKAESPSTGKVKIKLVVNEETRYLVVDLQTKYDELKSRIVSEYGNKVMKYTDQEVCLFVFFLLL